ncbi:MAG TPA: undecaprenyldiphospho-muramoylpentapeptide beta-N-acetylglucosaminyltransferase [bacterium]|nr:undecaprenyldiphospho-muramoylpentapeptide beta-N-acetylglucosaminyltransferase [bacterium]
MTPAPGGQTVKIVITGGGTGGHVFPGIALAQELGARPGVEILYVGKNTGPERQWVTDRGLPFEGIQASGFPRGLTLRLFTFWIDLLRGFSQAAALLDRFRPQVVFSTGGYVSVPVSVAASLRGVPVLLFEPNVTPGLAARLLAFFARRVFTGFEKTSRTFARRKAVWTGIPVRREILEAQREPSLKGFGLDGDKVTLLLLGGSQGAHTLNQMMTGAIRVLNDGADPLQVLMMTGRSDYQWALDETGQCALKVVLRPFFADIERAYAAADLVVARAGAITCAELLARGLPAILVPYPHASGHQEANARALEEAGAAQVLMEGDLQKGVLAGRIHELVAHPERLRAMGQKARENYKADASAAIARNVMELAQQQQRKSA